MDYKREYEKEMLENYKMSEYMLKQAKVIDKMAEMLNSFDIDEEICKNISKCKSEEDSSDGICKECIKKYFYEKVEEEMEKEKKGTATAIIYEHEKYGAKVFLDRKFFGSSDEVELLMWDTFKLQEKYSDIDFYYFRTEDIEDVEEYEKEHIIKFLRETSDLEKIEENLIKNKDWKNLYKYHKNQEWELEEWKK